MDEPTNTTTNAAGELVTSAAHLPEHLADPLWPRDSNCDTAPRATWSRSRRVYRCPVRADHLVGILFLCVPATNLDAGVCRL
jgi:hypothetical protein